MKKNNRNLILSLLLFTGFFSATTYLIGIQQGQILSPKESHKWNNVDIVLEHLLSNYVDSLETKNLSEKAINNILKDLDPHSTFIPSNQRIRLNESLVGHFGGIGIRFMIYNDNGPSKAAEIRKRDRIISIDQDNVAGINLKTEDVLKKLKGIIGSPVKLTILKPNKTIVSKTIIRGAIPLKSVPAFTMLNNEIGYIKISSFSNTTDLEFKAALQDIVNKGAKNLVLDLRFNGGGYLHQGTKP